MDRQHPISIVATIPINRQHPKSTVATIDYFLVIGIVQGVVIYEHYVLVAGKLYQAQGAYTRPRTIYLVPGIVVCASRSSRA